MEKELMISVGKIVGVQGLNGQLKLVPLSDHPGRFAEMTGKRFQWQRDGETRLVVVESVRGSGRPYYLLTLAGVNSRDLAQAFVGGDLAVSESELLPLPEGSFYIYQLVGLSVLDETGRVLGRIKEVLQPGSNDVYVVDGPLGQILIPALKSVVKSIDFCAHEVRVELPAGLLDKA